MIVYNPKEWLHLIVTFHKRGTFNMLLPFLIAIGIYAAVIVLVEVQYLPLHTKNSTVMHSILGFVLSMLLVFRTNSAYDRWWEGRKIWGSIVNNSRNLSLKLSVMLVHEKDREEVKHLIVNYVYSVKNHLRDRFIQQEFTPTKNIQLVDFADANHKPNFIAKNLYAKIHQLYQNKELAGDHLIILNDELKSFTDDCGACERIKNTPIPYSHNIFLKQMIFLYCMSIPIFFGSEFKYTTVPITMIVLYVFASIELIAQEIEDPFGVDENDLPLDGLCGKIKGNLNEIFSVKS